jgi:hypothetical protein
MSDEPKSNEELKPEDQAKAEEGEQVEEGLALNEKLVAAETPETVSPSAVEKVNYPRLPPRDLGSMTPKEYISERLNESIAWYDKNSSVLKSRFLNMRAITVISSALVPVLINLNIEVFDLNIDFKIITTILSLMVVILVSFESVYHYSAQWTNYRSTEQFLRKEYFRFTTREGEYAEASEEEAYRIFVQRVEGAIQAEVSTTLQVMNTTKSEGKSEDFSWQAISKPEKPSS